VDVFGADRTLWTVSVSNTGSPQWLVLGQSLSSGWPATVDGGASLGSPQLIDAYANGWYLPAQAPGHTQVIHIEWKPQAVIWTALSVSAASMLLCMLNAVWPAGMAWPEGEAAVAARSTAPPTGIPRGRRLRVRPATGVPAVLRRLPPPGRRPAPVTAVVAGLARRAPAAAVSRPANMTSAK
jgi:hypothetical protein